MKWIKHLLVVIFVILNFFDFLTTWLIVRAYPELAVFESNPIVNLLGFPIWLMFALKFLIVVLVVWILYSPFKSERSYFVWVTFILYLSVALGFAVYNNYSIYSSVDEVAVRLEVMESENENIEQEIRATNTSKYSWLVLTFIALPFLMAFIPYLVFEWTAPYQKFSKRRLIDKSNHSKKTTQGLNTFDGNQMGSKRG